jgi:TetR/AcrR family transcriptional regulator, transcriptional repressor for nem operon
MGRSSNADQRLMDAATFLLWGESYGCVTVDDICRKADVRKGSFYYFFESKSDLAVKALDRMWQDYRVQLEEMFAPHIPPIERIRNYCHNTYAVQADMREDHGRVIGCVLCALGSEIGSRDDAIRDKVRSLLDDVRGFWVQAISDGQVEGSIPPGDVSAKVRCTMAFYEGLVAQARLHNDLNRIVDLADQVCAHLRVSEPVSAS